MRRNYVAIALAVLVLAMFLYIVVGQVQEYSMQSDPILILLRDMLKRVHPAAENLKIYKGTKSFTINKAKVYLCLYDENGEYYPLQHLFYVLAHEFAHVLNTKDVGHTEEFNRIFEGILAKATQLGIYNPTVPIVQDYCNY